jgi:methylthioribose-1-phosphate isomerase
MDLSGVSANTPPQQGRAHTVEDLEAGVRITPGLLQVEDARGRVNGVPVAFQGEIDEFMTLFSGDPGRRRADMRVEISETSVDLDRLLSPARGRPAPGEAQAAETPSEAEAAESSGEAQAAESSGETEAAESSGEARGAKRVFLERFLVSRGGLRAEKAVYAKQPLADLTASFTYHHPVLRLEETRFRSSEGDWQVGGTVALDGGPIFDLDVEAAHVRVETLVQAFSKSGKPSRIFGILDGEAEFHGRGKGAAAWEKTLHGSGQVRLRDGRLPSFNIFESVIRAVLGLFSRILPINKIGTLSEPSTFQRFDQSFEIAGGRIRTKNLVLITDDYHLSGQGSCGIDATLDYTGPEPVLRQPEADPRPCDGHRRKAQDPSQRLRDPHGRVAGAARGGRRHRHRGGRRRQRRPGGPGGRGSPARDTPAAGGAPGPRDGPVGGPGAGEPGAGRRGAGGRAPPAGAGEGRSDPAGPGGPGTAPGTVGRAVRIGSPAREGKRLSSFKTLEWAGDAVLLLDQRKLPAEETMLACRSAEEVARAIEAMVVRGAPAIGVCAAMGIALGAKQIAAEAPAGFEQAFEALCRRMAATRPTAVNLFWAVDRMRARLARERGRPLAEIRQALEEEALAIHTEDVAVCQALGRHGASLVPDGARILTHCNAGALATGGYGTALGVVRAAVESGKRVEVISCETRPFLQGARLTVWELQKDGIPVTLITDNMAGHLMQRGEVDLVVVGADRVAANGDVANKIGTYTHAVLARTQKIPFYVAAPLSTLDLGTPTGLEIPIESRDPREVTRAAGQATAPEGTRALHPAFDVTPARYVSGIITEKGVARAPYRRSLARFVPGKKRT